MSETTEREHMELSIRNQLKGKVTDVKLGTIMSEVTVDVGGQTIVAAITRGSAERLQLAAGDNVAVLVKATEVMLGK
jgi:molybdopterin-binding protein